MSLRVASIVLIEHAYGQWADESGRWAIRRVRGETPQFLIRDCKAHWSETHDSLSAALEALRLRAGDTVSFQMERYSYER